MGLFGKKKTPEELLAEGRAQFESGDLKKMFLTLHGLANKGEPEACYYIGYYWLKERKDKGMAKSYLKTAAEHGHGEAARLLYSTYGILTQPPREAKAAPAEPAPQQEEDEMDALLRDMDEMKQTLEEMDAENRQWKFEQMRWEDQHRQTEAKPMPAKTQAPEPAPQSRPAPQPAPQPKPEEKAAPAAPRSQEDLEREANAALEKGNAAMEKMDCAGALSFWTKAAELGSVEAQFKCGVLYQSGMGTEEYWAKALYWYEKAAIQGSDAAQSKCALMYEMGWGTKSDKTKALFWYEKAAEKGDVDAQFNCGLMYEAGEGAPVDKPKALYWYDRASDQGHGGAMLGCALLYYQGEGVAKNNAKSKAYFKKAAAQTADRSVRQAAKNALRDFF